jgi:glycosyltransferase involved in cell wall biosynthesis
MYSLKLASLNLDIGICPLVDDEFNNHKSQLKWTEYSAMRIPSVVSDLPPYECVEDGVTGYKAKTTQEFIDKLSLLIESESLRKKITDNAFEKNYQDFNLKTNITKWVDFYENCHRRIWQCGATALR